ncbi:galectin-6-like isoform X1 [Schistocerca gregaria]|uniref:galectin-6-like isoform X1 n=1 Tax=Schistocerca gregaria TaxID=7010 RepID=UPI00211F4150|nr:galectin-6-like isoform X1 [Schistocerca gregaria]XP_049834574.1 galectin-6-like isoform X1 [Schistocerca gregaria]
MRGEAAAAMGWRCYCCADGGTCCGSASPAADDAESTRPLHSGSADAPPARGCKSVFYCCEGACSTGCAHAAKSDAPPAMRGHIVLGTPVDVAEDAARHFELLAQFPEDVQISRPGVPYVGELPVVLQPGRMVLVQGRVTPNAIRFSVNLACGSEPTSDIALHVNPRFDERRLVRNVRMAGTWGEEESSASWPFPMGRQLPFALLIYATTDVYYIAINGRHYCTYTHRIPLQKVQVVHISGDVEVDLLEYRRVEIYPEQYPGYKNPTVKIPMNKSLRDEHEDPLDTPFTGSLEEFGIGHELEITGRVKILPHSFYVNLQSGSYVCPHPIIPLHINPRFRAGYTMVRNAWVKGKWGTEEKAHCSHFRPGRPFCLKIVCTEDQYSVYVDGSLMDSFKYRCSPQIVDTLYIHGDIVLKDIVVK